MWGRQTLAPVALRASLRLAGASFDFVRGVLRVRGAGALWDASDVSIHEKSSANLPLPPFNCESGIG